LRVNRVVLVGARRQGERVGLGDGSTRGGGSLGTARHIELSIVAGIQLQANFLFCWCEQRLLPRHRERRARVGRVSRLCGAAASAARGSGGRRQRIDMAPALPNITPRGAAAGQPRKPPSGDAAAGGAGQVADWTPHDVAEWLYSFISSY